MKSRIFFLLLLLSVGSCTVEKRLYSRGFYTDFRKKTGPVERNSARKDERRATTQLVPLAAIKESDTIGTVTLRELAPDSIATVRSEDNVPESELVNTYRPYAGAMDRDRTRQSISGGSIQRIKASPSAAEIKKTEVHAVRKLKQTAHSESRSIRWGNFFLSLAVVGIIALGIMFPTFGIIMLILFIVFCVAALIWIFLDICSDIIDGIWGWTNF